MSCAGSCWYVATSIGRSLIMPDIGCRYAIRSYCPFRARREPSRALSCAAMSRSRSSRVKPRPVFAASWRIPITVCWSRIVCAWRAFSVITGIQSVLFNIRGKECGLTITLRISWSQSLEVVVISPLNHRLRPTSRLRKVHVVFPFFPPPASIPRSGS